MTPSPGTSGWAAIPVRYASIDTSDIYAKDYQIVWTKYSTHLNQTKRFVVQVVATVAQMTWARGTEKALRAENPVEEMKK